jgi:hypothetical protein
MALFMNHRVPMLSAVALTVACTGAELPVLDRVVLTPGAVSLQTGGSQQFTAAGIATDGSPIAVVIDWAATGGTITSTGVYSAAGTAGTYLVIAQDGPTGKADTSVVALTALPPPTSPAPSGAIVLNPGDDLPAAVNGRPAGTQFLIKAGIHRRQTIRPKDGMGFYGESGAILDGENVAYYAFETLNSAPRNVTIKGLVVQNYAPPSQQSAIQGDNGVDWLIQNNEIRYNQEQGIRLGKGTRALSNSVHHNAVVGIACHKCDNAVVEDNEVAYNNTANRSETPALAEASGGRAE